MKEKFHLIYIIVILIFAGTTIWWVDHSNKHDLAAEHYVQHIKDYPLLDPALPFYEKEDLIVNIQELREYLNALPEQNKDWADMSIYFEVLNTGANVSVNNDLRFFPASLAKLPAVMAAMKKVEYGEWNLQKTSFQLDLKEADLERSPSLKDSIGSEILLEDLIKQILLESDNTAYQVLLSELSEEELASLPNDVGLDTLFSNDGAINAKEFSRFYRALNSSTYLNNEYSQLVLQYLDESKYDGLLTAGLPKGIPFARKWGTNDLHNIYADGGIIYIQERPVMLMVMLQTKIENDQENTVRANTLFKGIASEVYRFVSEK